MPSTTIGILSDTHGLLRPEVAQALQGCDHLLHAGDIGAADVLEQLKRISPVTAVRGNMDYGTWSNALPINEMIEIAGVSIYLLHDLERLDLDPAAAGIQVVVSGHTHRARIYTHQQVTYINPGSAGYRRHDRSVTLATLQIPPRGGRARIVEVAVP